MRLMIRAGILVITLAVALSGCFGYDPFANDTIRLSASNAVAAVGDEVTFTAEHERGDARITIEEAEQQITPPQTIRTLPVLDGASIFIDERATLTVPLEQGRNRALGRDIYRYDHEDTVLGWGGERVHLTESGSLRVRTGETPMNRDGIVDATFTITMQSGSEQTVTLSLGERKTVSLDGQSATLEIIDVTMGSSRLEELIVRAEYSVPFFGTRSVDLDFGIGSGKWVNTGFSSFEVYLTDVTYSLHADGDSPVYLESDSDEHQLVIGRPVTLDGTTILPLELTSGASTGATVLLNPTVLIIGESVVRYPDETLAIDYTLDQTTASFTEDNSDSVFGTYRIEGTTIIDTYSIERVNEDSSSATFRFNVAGDYTAQATVTDQGVLVGEASTSVLIT
ncbi:MAG: hypothetical protein ACMXYM_01905 [Candidatus Woesearchaeota archaeon]